MDGKSVEVLEFPQIKALLAGYTSFSTSRELALNLEPLTDREQIIRLLRQSGEARYILSVEPGFSVGGVFDVREEVSLAARGKVLEPRSLLDIQQTLAAFNQLRRALAKLSAGTPLLEEIAQHLVEIRGVEDNISRCIAPGAEVRDDASPHLASIRHRLRELREQLLSRLEAIMRSPRGRRIVQEPIITEREGRYVIPVRVEFRHEIKGIVHDVSNTGATEFVEPWTTIEMGNTLREMSMEEKREIEKILRGLSIEVGAHEAEICRSVELAAEIDLALAKARYAHKAKATEPRLTGPGEDGGSSGILSLVEARHPLLGDKAVPLTVEIGRDYSVLVITGPNTGGKTVALKTVGLLCLMAQAGMPIPAAGESRVPVFDGVFADIGDEQSIEQTLSTFSWHMGNIVRIVNRATPNSLVLLDELGTSTDPSEGSALARSILLYFLSRKIMSIVTSHFGDLKAFAYSTPGMQNASLDLDPVTLTPTYRMIVGIPGSSHALTTASRLGLPENIVSRARDMLSKGSEELENLLAGLTEERRKTASLVDSLQKERNEVERRQVEMQNELNKLKIEERKAVQETRDQLVSESSELHREIKRVVAEMRREKSQENLEQARKSLAAIQERLRSEPWQAEPEAEAENAQRITAGDTVRLKDAGLQATVLSVSEETQQLEVQAGRTRITLGMDRVEKVGSDGKLAAPPVAVRVTSPVRSITAQLDLRGKRADEVEPLLDSYLNQAALANLREVRIIHGFATGTVREIVRSFLAAHPLVKSFRSGGRDEGGNGATVVSL